MQVDETLKFVCANAHVKHRKLAYGEIVDTYPDLFDMDRSPFVLAQVVPCVVGFPACMTFAVDCLDPPPEDQVYHLVEKLMSDELMPFAKSKMSLMSCLRHRSLYQELKLVAPSGRRVMLSCKSEMESVIGGRKTVSTYEKELWILLDRPKIVLPELKLLIQEARKIAQLPFVIEDGERHHGLNRATKTEMLQWIADHWEEYHERFTQIAVNQRPAVKFSAGQRRAQSYKARAFADD
jgi:hypothetical protein